MELQQLKSLLLRHGSSWTDVLVDELGLTQPEAERALPGIVAKLLVRDGDAGRISPADVADVAGPARIERSRARASLLRLAREVLRAARS